jgi:hypothetical protein
VTATVCDVLNDERQQRDEAANEQKPDFLRLAGSKPSHAQRNEDNDGNISARQ